ncbi:MAG: 1-phosphofructokinase [Ruminococcaceae bacterium]|nr:1-phosphofructokinase [Oscillospiraceae bacterium]
MIYTLTLNPAVDYYITVDDFKSGVVNRTKGEKISFGGKGINVSLMLKELGLKSTCMGFVGGFTGDALEKHLNSRGIECDFVKVSGNTRINVKLNDTDINAAGPDISDNELQQLYKEFDNLKSGDFLVLSGSVPKALPQNIYETILERLKNKGIEFVVDAEKDLLLNTLKYKPFLIKPNHHELGQIFGVKISDFDTALTYAKKLQDMGAKNVMVTLGELGAVLACKNGETYTQAAPKGNVISAVGAGDSAIAAFLYYFFYDQGYKYSLEFAVAAGSATAFSDGLATKNDIVKLMGEMI